MAWMAPIVPYIPAAIGAAGAFLSYKGQKSQGAARSEGFLMEQGAVDFRLMGFLQNLQAMQMEQAATVQAANFNAKTAMENAKIAREQAMAEAVQVNRNNLLRLGSLRAAAGASGLTYEGSVTDVVGDLVTQGELARQNVLYLGELEARGHNIDAHLESMRARHAYSAASMLPAQAELARRSAAYEKHILAVRAGAERKGARLGASATLLSGASNAYTQADRLGAFS